MALPTAASLRVLVTGSTRWTILVFEFDAWPFDYASLSWSYDVDWGDGSHDTSPVFGASMDPIIADGTSKPYFVSGVFDQTKGKPGLRLQHKYADDGPHTVSLTWSYSGTDGTSSGSLACGSWSRIVAAPPAVGSAPRLLVAVNQLNQEFDPQAPWGWEPALVLSAPFPVAPCPTFAPGFGSFSSPGPFIGDAGFRDWFMTAVGGEMVWVNRDSYDGQDPADFGGFAANGDGGMVGVADGINAGWTVSDDAVGWNGQPTVQQYAQDEILMDAPAVAVTDPTGLISVGVRRYSTTAGAILGVPTPLFPPPALISPDPGDTTQNLGPNLPAGDSKAAFLSFDTPFNTVWEWDYANGTLFPLFDYEILLSTVPLPTGWTSPLGTMEIGSARRRSDGGWIFLAFRSETDGTHRGGDSYLIAVSPAGEIDNYARLGGGCNSSGFPQSWIQPPNVFAEGADRTVVFVNYFASDPAHDHCYVARLLDPYADRQRNASNTWFGPPWPSGWSGSGFVQYVTQISRFSMSNPAAGPTTVGWFEHPNWNWTCFDVPPGPPFFGGIAHRWDFELGAMGEGRIPGGSWAPRGNGPCGQPIYQRSYPRDDDLGAGDARSWPPPTSSQRGVRSLPNAVF